MLDYQAQGFTQYPLYAVRSRNWQVERPTVLLTGGVHGYETSGVQGALQFIAQHFAHYSKQVNLLVLPCISHWGYEYETINRWNPNLHCSTHRSCEQVLLRDLSLTMSANCLAVNPKRFAVLVSVKRQ